MAETPMGVPLAQFHESVEELLCESAMAQAADLTRANQHAAAADILAPWLATENPSPALLDLAARIAGRRGELVEAARLWERAAALAPGDAAYRRATLQARRWQRFPRWWLRARLAAVGVAVALVAIGGLAVGFDGWLPAPPAGDALTTVVEPTATVAVPEHLSTPIPPDLETPARRALRGVAFQQVIVQQDGRGLRLSGTVPSEHAFRQALTLSAETDGVDWVDGSQLGITPPDLAALVTDLLAEDARFGDVTVVQDADGILLHGSVASEADMRLAQTVASTAPGVRYVDTRNLTITPVDLITPVKAALAADPAVARLGLQVTQTGTVVHLEGLAPRAEDVVRAVELAAGVQGAATIDASRVTVAHPDLALRLATALANDPRTAPLSVAVVRHDDSIGLEATLDSEAEREALVAVVRDVVGATFVDTSRLQVAPRRVTYIVQPGDSLWSIAVRLAGDGLAWRAVYDVNRDVLEHPDLLHPGMELRVP